MRSKATTATEELTRFSAQVFHPMWPGSSIHRRFSSLLVLPLLALSSAAAQSLFPESASLAPWSPTSVEPVTQSQPTNTPPAPDCSLKVTVNLNSPETPDAPSAYVPLSRECKFKLFLHQTYSPYTFASVAYEATWAQAMAQWPQYGGGMQGWGKRLGATLADTESRRFIQGYLLSSEFHEDPRYFPSSQKTILRRAWYAATRVLITRADSGQNELNRSELLGALSTSSLQNLYYPSEYRTLHSTISRYAGALSSDATSDILKEFTPDLKRLFHRHAPKKIQELEEKVPEQYRW
jgi:hypothetical protein